MSFLEGLGLSGYRSFGPEMQRMGPFSMMNIIVGQNNSGKSNILTFISKRLVQFKEVTDSSLGFLDIDSHKGPTRAPFGAALGMDLRGSIREDVVLRMSGNKEPRVLQSAMEGILTITDLWEEGPLKWFDYRRPEKEGQPFAFNSKKYESRTDQDDPLLNPIWYNLFTALGIGGNYLAPDTRAKCLQAISPGGLEFPKAHFIPAIRKVGDPLSEAVDFSGVGIIKRLHEIQHPDYNEYHKKKQFDTITKFVQTVLEDSSARIEVPYNAKDIHITIGDKTLPIDSMGTGIHEVIILAVAATLIENSIMCIEEPELHLHPTLQRKLISYLSNTSNQYFITTHSAHLIDTPHAAIFNVKLEDGQTKVTSITTAHGRFEACADLGFRASDLVQANSIIWVEGPSDRIYLNYWISLMEMSLVEGVHYSIMFYGGALRAHLSGLEPDVQSLNDFVSLLPLNRNMVIVMDSDKISLEQELNAAVERLVLEFDKGVGFAWVTCGRTIENYIPYDVLTQAVKNAHPSAKEVNPYDQFGDALSITKNSGNLLQSPDKVSIAHEAVKLGIEINQFNLKGVLLKLVAFINKANGRL